ncbi:type II toxin-antitoxin system HipA family toxin [Noviherbaspirillum pedocola]|uniref:Type II toxin-antitoxin system HipA family toxin n=1 Tax=Noviherbaspirillum pedocola TaxID=2801341 RepID=A0A934W1F5_9BURK|nr:type II toxin-antitoxin system HipA family toxin [Noviherbaspirillum pedocola]MBK4735116.1 type II toxin-antitoxin system HipA family toxin [Noviherbaspirillum pedocola]
MGRPSKTQALAVWQNGVRVGEWRLPPQGEPVFAYDADWFASSACRSLSLSLPAIEAHPIVRSEAVNFFFDNLLPDSEAIRRRVQQRFRADDASAFSLLGAIGRDCAGAIQLLPPDEEPRNWRSIEAEPLGEDDVERLLRNTVNPAHALAPGGEEDLRLSIAGAQEKTALLWNEGNWCLPRNSTPTTHIFKLPLGLVGNRRADMSTSVENEWLCARILEAFGLPVPRSAILVFGATRALVVERFDRRLSRDGYWLRLPQEDFCQAHGVPASRRYEADGGVGMHAIATLLANSAARDEDLKVFLKAQVVFWLLRATDGHAKNFSLFLEAGDRYRLTPLYDVISTWPIIGTGANQLAPQEVKMAMAWIGRNRHYRAAEVQRRHMVETARRCGYGGAPDALIDEAIDAAPGVATTVWQALPPGFPEALAQRILDGMLAAAAQLRS